jgi:hypothetical protein
MPNGICAGSNREGLCIEERLREVGVLKKYAFFLPYKRVLPIELYVREPDNISTSGIVD